MIKSRLNRLRRDSFRDFIHVNDSISAMRPCKTVYGWRDRVIRLRCVRKCPCEASGAFLISIVSRMAVNFKLDHGFSCIDLFFFPSYRTSRGNSGRKFNTDEMPDRRTVDRSSLGAVKILCVAPNVVGLWRRARNKWQT